MLELPVVGVQAEFLNLEDHVQGDEVHDDRVGVDDEPRVQAGCHQDDFDGVKSGKG